MTEDSLFARCIALGHSPLLNERQIGWSGRWTLMGDFMVCSQCLAAQAIDRAHHPFPHLPDCVAIPHARSPWHELQRLLNQIPPLRGCETEELINSKGASPDGNQAG
ncbi:hypothetical protein QN399_26040 [Pseudomonas sp. 10C3]|uniref:hypothetical protein n=1 Tax=Pseudomonas sp. 10C3 TaxID=3118753 RepID=UPI002E7FBD0A|nr:hypothetical protein [Pseudomonas sp. 10C3]MEE3509655.1 hypothetical protein [Pseudomonas sp. 10C3]